MKKVQLVFIFLISVITTFAQVPEAMSYQAVVRDINDALITNQVVGMQISILKSGGGDVYIETQTPMTNANGLVTLEIGTGTIQFGVFADIPWDSASYDIKVETDLAGGTNYTITGQSQILSIPYALYAKSSGDDHSKIFDTDGDTQIQTEESPNENIIRFDLGGTAKWVMRNNALEQLNSGGSLFIGQDAGTNDDLTDNKNIFFGDGAGFSNTYGENNVAIGSEALVSNTYSNNNIAIGNKSLYSTGGIGHRNIAIGTQSLYSNIKGDDNISLGYQSLFFNTDGNSNIALGYYALLQNTIGTGNVALGNSALGLNETGYHNIAIGTNAISRSPQVSGLIAIGYDVLAYNDTGEKNVGIGHQTLSANTSGSFNTAVGYNSLVKNTTGLGNSTLGFSSLNNNEDGFDNVAIGNNALLDNISGNSNIAIGNSALGNQTIGESNIAIGKQALATNIDGNNNVVLGNSTFFNAKGNNNIGIGFNVDIPNSNGDNQIRIGNTDITYAGVQVAWTVTSDRRWKDEIRTLPYGLDFVKQLKPVDYVRKNNVTHTREIGFIAQDVEALLNEVGYTNQGILHKDDQGMMSLRYNDFIPVLAKAIQDQQKIIEQQQNKIDGLSATASKIDDLKSQIEILKEMILTNQ